jgi:hypothetical protein
LERNLARSGANLVDGRMIVEATAPGIDAQLDDFP